ncbi:MAG TPA: DPP IV N-terminal domain-containing protein [Pyrinomonadaceae bacterium]|nr:DPP IV N-terminal domain-containing protein [Pyrinomonadaceae bacterium]
MTKENRRFYEFGPFRIDTRNRQLLRENELVPLRAKAVDILLLLIESRGDVVEKDDLMQRLWPDSFVEDANLTQNIYTLRKTLGGDYIQTVPRRGYRFVAEVREADDAADVIVIKERTRTSVSYEEEFEPTEQMLPGNGSEAPNALISRIVDRRGPKSRARIVLIAIAVVALVVLVVGGIWWLRMRVAPFTVVKLAKFTTTGKAVKVAISPDGKYVAYAFSDAGEQSVWLRQTATNKELQIVPPERTDIYGLTFTRDGNYVFYVSQRQNQLAILYQVPSLGGAADKLLDDVDSPVTFSPNGKQMAFIRFSPGNASIIIANIDGTSERTLVTTRAGDALRLGPNGVLPLSWSPDGEIIAAPVSINSTQWDQTVYGFRVQDGAGVQLTANHWPALGRIEWEPRGKGILATIIESEATSEQQVWFVPYPKGEARRITNDLMDYRDLGITADAKTLVTIQSEKKANLWIATASDLDHPTQLTSTSYDGLNGISWTPDRKIVYTSQINGEQNLWITEPNLTPKQLTAHAGFSEQPAVSPDGRYIVFLSNRNDQEHLWRIDIDGKHPMQLTRGQGDRQPTFTADGQAVVFRSGSPSSLYRVSIDGGEPVRLTERGGFDPNVSPDGKTIVCGYRPAPAAKNQIAMVGIEGGQPKMIGDWPAQFGRIRWMPDGNAVAYAARQAGVGNIWIQPLTGGAPTQLTHWNANPIFSFDWSRDGKWLAYASGSLTSDVILISDAGN